MKISKTKILTILVSLIGILNYEQSKINSDIISTWKFIENKTESNQNKIDVGELVIYGDDGEIEKSVTEKGKNYKSNDKNFIYIKIDKNFITQYYYGNAYRYKYTLKDNTIKLGQYVLNIVSLTEEILTLMGEKELKFEKVEIDLSSYRLYKNKEPVYGLFNPLILFSYPNG